MVVKDKGGTLIVKKKILKSRKGILIVFAQAHEILVFVFKKNPHDVVHSLNTFVLSLGSLKIISPLPGPPPPPFKNPCVLLGEKLTSNSLETWVSYFILKQQTYHMICHFWLSHTTYQKITKYEWLGRQCVWTVVALKMPPDK